MSTKSRQAIYGGRITGARIRAESARKRAAEAAREADRAEAEMMMCRSKWKPMVGPGSHRQPSASVSTAGTAG